MPGLTIRRGKNGDGAPDKVRGAGVPAGPGGHGGPPHCTRWRAEPQTRLHLLAFPALLAAGCAFHPRGTCGPACPAIEAATTIEFQIDRLEVLKQIAARKELSTHEQIYLVNAVCLGGFGDDQADALVTLLKNPGCTDETRKHIAQMLHWVHLGNAKKRVVDALNASTGTAAEKPAADAGRPTTARAGGQGGPGPGSEPPR